MTPASKTIRDEFAKRSERNASNNKFNDIGYNVDDLAAMLAFSPYLQRLALRHHNDIAGNLQSHNYQQIELARITFIDEMETADCDTAAMRAIRKWRERSALAIALGDIAGLHDMPTQMLWLSDAAQTVLTHTVGYLFVAHPSKATSSFLPRILPAAVGLCLRLANWAQVSLIFRQTLI